MKENEDFNGPMGIPIFDWVLLGLTLSIVVGIIAGLLFWGL